MCQSQLFLFLAAVTSVQAATLRGRQYQHHEHARQQPAGRVPAILMPRGVMACPRGQQIRSQLDCDAAFSTIVTKYDYVSERPEALPVSWPHIPKGCSVSKGKAYFNTDASVLTRGDSAVGNTLSFHVVCAPAAYKEFSHKQFCQGGVVLYNGGGPTAEGRFKNLDACQEECDEDPRCNFFMWKFEQGTSWVHHCATFKHCNNPETYTDGDSATVFRKLPSPAPRSSVGQNRIDPADRLSKSGSLHLRRISREDHVGGELSAASAAAAPRPKRGALLPKPAAVPNYRAPAAGAWFACQLVGGRERIVWTAEHMAVLTRSTREEHCGKHNKLHCMRDRFYTGKWSVEADALQGASVSLNWDYIPPIRLSTVDGGYSFRSSDGKKSYTCTKPPRSFFDRIQAGIKESQAKLAKAQRTKAGLPSSYTEHGCLAIPVTPANLWYSRQMSQSKCFTHCAKTKGFHYFAMTGGDSCFCSATPPGTPQNEGEDNCDLMCSGKEEELCGGFSGFASVYTMIDCLPPDAQELKEDAADRLARLQSVYSSKKAQTCGQAKGNVIELDGSKWLVGRPLQCKQACLTAKGAFKCHGFTYSAAYNRCTFIMDAFWGNATVDPHSTCYFKKSKPLAM